MEHQLALFGELAQRLDLVNRVDCAGLGDLRDRQSGRLYRFDDAGCKMTDHGCKSLHRQFAADTRYADELCPVCEHFGCAAFVIKHMGFRMTENSSPRWRHGCQRQRIGSGPGGYQKHTHLMLKHL